MAIAIPFKVYAVLIFLVFAGVWLALFFTVLNRSQFADTTCATLNGATYRSRRCPRALGVSGVRSSRSGPCRTPCQGTACNTFSELSSSSTRRGRRRSLQKVLSRSCGLGRPGVTVARGILGLVWHCDAVRRVREASAHVTLYLMRRAVSGCMLSAMYHVARRMLGGHVNLWCSVRCLREGPRYVLPVPICRYLRTHLRSGSAVVYSSLYWQAYDSINRVPPN